MSRSFILKSAIAISIGAVAGYNSVQYFKNRNSSHRYLASITMSKLASEQLSKTLVDVKIKNVEVGLTDSDTSTVKVILTAYKPIAAGLTYNWNIPSDVQVLQGQTSGSLPEFAANQTQELVLKLSGYNKVKKNYVSFTLAGDVDATRFQREVLASSRPEDSFEYVVQEYERSKANDVRVNSKLGKSEYKAPIDLKKVVH